MKKLREAWERWKVRHWDDDFQIEEDEIPWLWIERKPLRRFWEDNKSWIKKGLGWLLPLIFGALILKLLGLA